MSSERAKESALAQLHADLATTLSEQIKAAPDSAAVLNVARQFLKDNDIKVLPNGDTPLDRLGKVVSGKGVSLPFEGDPKTH